MITVRACPGCGVEYGPSGKCFECSYEWDEQRREERRQQAATEAELRAAAWRERRRLEIEAQLARQRDLEWQRQERERQVARELERIIPSRVVRKTRRKVSRKKKPDVSSGTWPEELRDVKERPASPQNLQRSWQRIALAVYLSNERRFLDQRNEDAHRYFLRVLERVAPPREDDPEDWPEIVGRRNVHPWRRAWLPAGI